MLPLAVLRGVNAGSIDRAFRRWDRPRVKAGGRQRTALGVIGFTTVDVVAREDLTAVDATRAGFVSLERLLAVLDRRLERPIFRIGLELVGPDPRIALRETLPDARDLDEIVGRLDRLDQASRHGPWTRAVLTAIAERAGTPAVELAEAFGREKMLFKLDVRKLKELGLTESLRPGYRLSPRGESVLGWLRQRR